ncbi:MAG: TetR/AcrR family transcriptional regulator [Paracoccaceae bacterium]|nr:TetR/AcrR family transcriptional regulator [Paracoccaceae bacterium]
MARRVGSDGLRTAAAIREAALRLIARYGYEAMSMRRLAEEIDLGAAALYRYFPNKQAMLFSLLKTHMDDLLAAWDEARLPRSAPAPQRLEAFTRFHIRHHLPRAEGVFLSYMELRSLTPANFDVIEGMRQVYEHDLAEILADGAKAGTLIMDEPRVTARAIIALLTGITTWYRESGPLDPAKIERIYWNIVARMTGVETREAMACS